MDVDIVAVGKVIVDNEVDSLEVHPTTHDVSTDQNPNDAGPEPTDHCVSLYRHKQSSTHNDISSQHNQKKFVLLLVETMVEFFFKSRSI